MNKIEVNTRLCKGCYLCIEVCKNKNIEMAEHNNGSQYLCVFQIEGAKCTACARCARICPEAAIEVYLDRVKN